MDGELDGRKSGDRHVDLRCRAGHLAKEPWPLLLLAALLQGLGLALVHLRTRAGESRCRPVLWLRWRDVGPCWGDGRTARR